MLPKTLQGNLLTLFSTKQLSKCIRITDWSNSNWHGLRSWRTAVAYATENKPQSLIPACNMTFMTFNFNTFISFVNDDSCDTWRATSLTGVNCKLSYKHTVSSSQLIFVAQIQWACFLMCITCIQLVLLCGDTRPAATNKGSLKPPMCWKLCLSNVCAARTKSEFNNPWRSNNSNLSPTPKDNDAIHILPIKHKEILLIISWMILKIVGIF